jgi:hypothetical protein
MIGDRCPYCQQTLSSDHVALWDERQYCRQCVERVSPRLYRLALSHELLQETIPAKALRPNHLFWIVARQIFVVGGVIICAGVLWAVVAIGLRPLPAILLMLGFIGIPLSLLVVLASLLTSVVCYLLMRPQLPRTILIDQRLAICQAGKVQRSPLRECSWHDGEPMTDTIANLAGVRRGITLQTRSGAYAIGHQSENAELFRAFLTLSRTQQRPPATFRGYVASVVTGCTLGSLLGLLTGGIVAAISHDDQWLARRVWLGMIDGLLGGTYLARLKVPLRVESPPPLGDPAAVRRHRLPHRRADRRPHRPGPGHRQRRRRRLHRLAVPASLGERGGQRRARLAAASELLHSSPASTPGPVRMRKRPRQVSMG